MDRPHFQQAHSVEEGHELVRSFSDEIGPKVKYPNAIHAVADYTKKERLEEAAKWRTHFLGRGTNGYEDVQFSNIRLTLADFN